MAHENRFLTYTGTSIWFQQTGTEYSGSGTPWDTQSTTPFEIAMSDVTGERWTPTEATGVNVFAGGGPFRDGGDLVSRSYPNTPDVLPIHVRGTTQDNMVAALRLLRQELRSVAYKAPAVFVFKPDGATNAGYTEVYAIDVAPNPLFINDENGRKCLRAVLTLTRAPFFTNLASGATALSSGTHTNAVGSNTRNFTATPVGDLTYEGQPVNLALTPVSSATITKLWMAVISNSTSSTSGAATYTGASGNIAKVTISLTLADFANNDRLKLRVLQRFSSATSATVQVLVPGAGYSAEVSASGTNQVVDYGEFPTEVLQRQSSTIEVTLYLKTGGPVTLVNTELLAYYDFGYFSSFSPAPSSSIPLTVNRFREISNRATLPFGAPDIYTTSSASKASPPFLYGSAPYIYPSSKLWLAWHGSAGYNTGHQITTVAQYAPQFLSFRGAQ